jgi:peroxiredoxin
MTSSTIALQASQLAKQIARQPQSDVLSVFATEQAELEAKGAPGGVIAAGAKLPNAVLLDPYGEAIGLYGALAERPAVIVFYRGVWCPYCNIALRTYQSELVPELDRRGVALLAVSPQKPDGSLSMQEKHDLSYTVLSDPGNILAGTVGIVTVPSAEVRQAQLQLGLDLTAGNADGTIGIPIATTLIVDGDQVVRWVDVHPNYATRSEPAAILAALDATVTERVELSA